jgi:hypothetical protein
VGCFTIKTSEVNDKICVPIFADSGTKVLLLSLLLLTALTRNAGWRCWDLYTPAEDHDLLLKKIVIDWC